MSVLVADREVPLVLASSYSNADDVPIIPSPAWAKRSKVRVFGFQIDGNFFVARQIRILSGDVPILFNDVHLPFNMKGKVAVLIVLFGE